MFSPVSAITRQATYKEGEPLNILTCCTHEAYETNLAKTGHNFYAWQGENIKQWNTKYRPVPDNYHILDRSLGTKQIPMELDIDLVLSQNKFGQYSVLSRIARMLHLPLISLEHTLPFPGWPQERTRQIASMAGQLNVFISDFSKEEWGYKDVESAKTIKHCIDSSAFYNMNIPRNNKVITVNNDFINRDWCLGFRIWQETVSGLDYSVYGDTEGLSSTLDQNGLFAAFNTHKVYLNTTTFSPLPTAMCEAMACGCVPVSLKNCMIPEVIEHGVNGFMAENPNELRMYCQKLLDEPELYQKMSEKSISTIVNNLSVDRFCSEWNESFHMVRKSDVGAIL